MPRFPFRRGAALLLAVSLAGATSSACVMSSRDARTLTHFATAALWTAAIVGHVALLAHHDAHYHHDHCGHYRRWHSGRWVYHYDGHWEYYDDGAGSWYYYED